MSRTYVCTILFVNISSQNRSPYPIISCTWVSSICALPGAGFSMCLVGGKWWENTDQAMVLITISVYVVINTKVSQEVQSLTIVYPSLTWVMCWRVAGPWLWPEMRSLHQHRMETHFQGSKFECLELYCYYTANNWCQLYRKSKDPSVFIIPAPSIRPNVIKKTSYLSISRCRMKKTSFSVAAAQSVSISGVEDKPTN